MSKYYNKEGELIELMEWVRLFGNKEYKVVEQTTLKNGIRVSTVWLGLDHNFGEGLPLIFETMVFPKEGDFRELDMERYETLEQAKKGYKEMVKKWDD